MSRLVSRHDLTICIVDESLEEYHIVFIMTSYVHVFLTYHFIVLFFFLIHLLGIVVLLAKLAFIAKL